MTYFCHKYWLHGRTSVCVLKRREGEGVYWIKLAQDEACFEHGNEHSVSIKCGLAEQTLASQEGLCNVEINQLANQIYVSV
jgi:hypothetical protein